MRKPIDNRFPPTPGIAKATARMESPKRAAPNELDAQTPTRWTAVGFKIYASKAPYYGVRGKPLATFVKAEDVDRAVRAVNAHDAMLAALQWAVGMAEEAIMVREEGDDPDDTPEIIALHRAELAEARTAIAQAKAVQS